MIRDCWAAVVFVLIVAGLSAWAAHIELRKRRKTICINGEEKTRTF